MRHFLNQLSCASFAFCLFPLTTKAQVVVDPNVAANQRATILQTANGLPQINIQTPSSAGISRNTFSQFDILQKGAILNNARTASQTQLSGWVQGNPWLSTGSAKVILNEINSSKPSQINGFLEVAGSRAEVVIANPAGITVNGGGFINASKATLTTGTPHMLEGQLDSYRVQGGKIAIEGAGLDLRTTDYAAILARAIEVNAGIWANELQAITGANTISASTLSSGVTPITSPIPGSNPPPGIAIDIAQLGGMYAGKIFLKGTEEGLGMRSAGLISTHNGNLEIRNNGPLTTSGTIHAKGDLVIHLQSDFSTDGKLQAEKDINLHTTGKFHNQIELSTPGSLHISASEVINDNALGSAALLHIQAGHSVVNTGKIIAPSITISAGSIIRNTGPNALVGATDTQGHLTLLAPTIENTDDVTSTDSVATTTLLGIGTVTLAGGLDANGEFTKASSVVNRSALMESSGNMLIHADVLHNSRRTLEMSTVFDQAASPSDLSALGLPMSGSTGQVNVRNPNSIGGVYIEPPRGGSMNSDYMRTDFSATGSQNSVVSISPKAQIIAGGNLRPKVATLKNYWSQIASVGDIDLSGATLDQDSWRGSPLPQIKVAYSGSYIYRTYKGNIWSHTFCDSGCSAPGDNRFFNANRYESSFASHADIVGSGAGINNGAAAKEAWVAPLQYLIHPNPIVLTGNAISQIVLDPQRNYFIATDPLFTSYQQWLSSDYMLDNIALDPSITQKRLGDGFYEQRLIREQIFNLTGKPWLSSYTDAQTQYADLMANGVTLAKTTPLRLGIALNAEQMAQLTSDIVWLVQQEVMLPDGTIGKALVPQIYLAYTKHFQPRPAGARVTGNNIKLTNLRGFKNAGALHASQDLELQTDNALDNAFGVLHAGRNMLLAARSGIDLRSAQVQALNLDMQSDGTISLVTTTHSDLQKNASGSSFQTRLGPTAEIKVGQDARIASGKDLKIAGANIQIGGDLHASAGASITIEAVQTEDQKSLQRFGGIGSADIKVQHASAISVGENTNITSGENIHIAGSHLTLGSSGTHQALLTAGGAISIAAVKDTSDILSSQSEKRWHSTNASRVASHSESVKGTHLVSSGDLQLISGKDITIDGSSVIADKNIQIDAQGDVQISSTAQTQERKSSFENSRKNLIAQSHRLDEEQIASTIAKESLVSSTSGDIHIQAGKNYKQTGSDMVSTAGDISISAENVTIQEARETLTHQQTHSSSSSGLNVTMSNPVITAAQSVQKLAQAAQQTNNDRMAAMALASSALTISQAIDAVHASPITIGGISLGAGIGKKSLDSTSSYQRDAAKGSSLTAGGDISIVASGDSQSSNITVQGSQISATGATTITADNAVALKAAVNNSTFTQQTHFSSSNAGVAMHSNAGIGATASFSSGQGKTQASDQTYSNTQIKGQTIQIQSDGDTSLNGAVVTGNQISVDVGGDFHLSSQQDRNTFTTSEQNRGLGAVLPIVGANYGGSTSGGKTAIESHYASVREQSGLRAGDGGFSVHVAGHTSLQGGAITSTQNAVDTKSNSFSSGATSLSHIGNTANYHAQSISIAAGVTGAGEIAQPLNNLGTGTKSGSTSNTTLAAITGIAGNKSALTGDALTGLDKIFDASSVKAQVQSQVSITSAFGKQASKAVGDYADSKLRDAIALGDQACIQDWQEGGAARLGLHALVGGLSANLSGAAGAVTSQAFVPFVGNALNDADLPLEVKQAIVLAAGTAVGSALGGLSGAASSYNATSNNYLTHDEDMQRNVLRKAKATQNCDTQCEKDLALLDALDESRDSEIQNVISLCRKVRTANNCLAVARHYADVNGYGFASAKYESVGRTGSPFSFNGYLINKGTQDERYEIPHIKLSNGTSEPDPGGFSYGMFQLSANRGGMEEFLKYLRNPYASKEANGFYNELAQAGGLEAARNGEKQFVQKFMELSQRDPQFIQYQFESINQTGLKKYIVGGLRDLGYEFHDLEPMEKEALFSLAVQNGGLGAYRAASYVMFGSYFQKKMEYLAAIKDGNALTVNSNALLNRKIDLLLTKDSATPQRIKDINSEISILDQKIAEQREKINANASYAQGIRDWLKVAGAIGPLDDEGFINALYDWRIKSRPSEAASRYIPERDMLLKMLKEKNAQKVQQ